MTSIDRNLIPETVPPVTCHFFRLPGELRNRIYRLIVAEHFDHTTVLSLLVDTSVPPSYRPLPVQPYMASTCRQIRHEVLSIFYGERTFQIDPEICSQGLVRTWSNIMRPSLLHLRSMRFTLKTEGSHSDTVVEAQLTDLSLSCCVPETDQCRCKFDRCARNVERGILGSQADNILVRFLIAWDIPKPPPKSADRYQYCSHCGRPNMYMSLRGIYEEDP